MPRIILPKKYTDVEIIDGKWTCPECQSCITIKRFPDRLARIKEHLNSKKHTAVIQYNENPSELESMKQLITTM